MKQKKILSFLAEFIVAPVFYLVSAVFFLFFAVCLYCYFTRKPSVQDPSSEETITQVYVKKDDIPEEPSVSVPQQETQLQLIARSCDSPWTASPADLSEIKGTIRKVAYNPQAENGLTALHLDVETADQQNFIIHVSPESKISRCPDVFAFQEEETVTVIGSELLSPGEQKNICAAEIIRQNADVLKIRDRITGTYNNAICEKDSPEPPAIARSCDSPWTASPAGLSEITGTIRKVESSSHPGNGLTALHLDVETADQQNFIIHVSPEYKISRCPDLFAFQEEETVTVIGSELLSPGEQKNICAAEIIRQNEDVLKIRDRTTGKYNNAIFNHTICNKKLPSSIYSCNSPWTSPLMEIEGIIRKVQYKKPPWAAAWSNRKGLHLDVETADQQSVAIHVFPEPKIRQCPDLFNFEEGKRVIVVGSAFSTPESEKNICAAEIVRQHSEIPELRVREAVTGNHNNAMFNCTMCVDEVELKRTCLFNWVKNYTDILCKDCTEEIAAGNYSTELSENCKSCFEGIARIPGVYTDDCTHCQKIMCSSFCSGSVSYIMPPLCWKNCMETCGSNTGKGSACLIKLQRGGRCE